MHGVIGVAHRQQLLLRLSHEFLPLRRFFEVVHACRLDCRLASLMLRLLSKKKLASLMGTSRVFGRVTRCSLSLVLAANLLTTRVQFARVDGRWVHGRLATVTAAHTVIVCHGLPGLLGTDCLP